MKNLLYYPNIVIPIDQIKQSILYSNQISTILPQYSDIRTFVEFEDTNIIHALEYLEQMGIYKPVYTNSDIIRSTKGALFHNCDEAYLEDARKRFLDMDYSKIWDRKIDDDISDFFTTNKIGRKDNNGYMIVERQLASKYMSIMAYHYSSLHQNEVAVLTNNEENQGLLYEREFAGEADTFARRIIFREILPVPSNDATIDDIINFKTERKDELREVMDTIDKIVWEINQSQSIEEARFSTNKWTKTLKNQSNDLKRMQKKSIFETVLIASLAYMAPIMVGEISPEHVFGIGLTIGGLILIKDINYKNKVWNNPRQILPMSYIIQAKNAGIIG